MSGHEFPLKGFPGDGDPDIELHHGKPAYWAPKNTVISVLSLIVLIIIGAIVYSSMT